MQRKKKGITAKNKNKKPEAILWFKDQNTKQGSLEKCFPEEKNPVS